MLIPFLPLLTQPTNQVIASSPSISYARCHAPCSVRTRHTERITSNVTLGSQQSDDHMSNPSQYEFWTVWYNSEYKCPSSCQSLHLNSRQYHYIYFEILLYYIVHYSISISSRISIRFFFFHLQNGFLHHLSWSSSSSMELNVGYYHGTVFRFSCCRDRRLH